MLSAGEILLIKRARPPWEGLWAIPGGRVEWGETMEQAVIREVMEETGLQIRPGEVAWVGEILDDATPPEWHYGVIDFFATIEGGELAPGADASEVQWWPVRKLDELPIAPSLIDLVQQVWPQLR